MAIEQDVWFTVLIAQAVLFALFCAGVAIVFIAGKWAKRSPSSTRISAASVVSFLLACFAIQLMLIGPNTGTAICYVGNLFFGEISAMAVGFSLYAIKRMQKGQRFLPIMSGVLALASLIIEIVLVLSGDWVNHHVF